MHGRTAEWERSSGDIEEVLMRTMDDEPGGIGRDGEGRDSQSRGRTGAASGRRGPGLALIAFLLVAAYAVAFFLRNSHETKVDFVFGETDTTLRWALLMAVVLGIVLDRLITAWWRAARRRRR
jgi:uncharacterized integral membrane protein